MGIIDTLQFKTAVDTGGLKAGVASMIDLSSSAASRIQTTLGGINTGALSAAGGFAAMGVAALAVVPAVATINVATKGLELGFNFLKQGVVSASDLAETLSMTEVVLGDASGAVVKFADDMAKRFGLVKGTILETAASMGGLGKSLGNLSGDKLAGFSTQFTKLAADLASIKNLDLKTAADALRIGLAGNQSDKLRELGVITTEAAVKQYALARGIAKVGSELNEEQKFMARAGLISEGLAFANGDLERTIDGTANGYRKFTGTLENLATSLGEKLSPATNELVKLLNELATTGVAALESVGPAIKDFSAGLGHVFGDTSILVRNWQDTLEILKLTTGQTLINMGEDFKAFVKQVAVGPLGELLGISGPAQHIDLSGQIDAIVTGMGNREAARTKLGGLGPKAEPPKIDASAAMATEKLHDFAEKLIERSLSPMEEYSRDLGKLQQALRSNLITADQFAKGQAKLFEDSPIGKLLERAKTPMELFTKEINNLREAMAKGIITQEQYDKGARQLLTDSPLGKFAEQFKESALTPLEKLKTFVSQGREAFAKGLIDQNAYSRLGDVAAKQFGLDGGGTKEGEPIRLAGALELGSKDAYSVFANAFAGGGRDRAMAEQNRLNGEQLAQQKGMLSVLKDIRRETKSKQKQALVIG